MATRSDGQKPKRAVEVSEGVRVTRLELLFDLVFVFAFLNINQLTAKQLNGAGLTRGLLLLILLWWVWICYSWLGNAVRMDRGLAPIALFTAMIAIFLVTVTAAEAFEDKPGGPIVPLVFPVCYLVVRTIHLGMLWYIAESDRALREQVFRNYLTMLAAVACLFAAALLPLALDGRHAFLIRVTLWSAAIAIEYVGGFVVGSKGWRVVSAAHFAERYSLIIIIAIGELIIATGLGGSLGTPWPVTWPAVIALVLGILVAISLWWAYFDVVAFAAELALRQAKGRARAALARDAYTYLHLPMIIGVSLLALGVREVLKFVSSHEADGLFSPPPFMVPAMLYSGVVLFLLGHLLFQLRSLGTVTWLRVGTIALLLALIPLVGRVPPLVAMGLLAVICVALMLTENALFAGSRRALHEAPTEPHLAD